MSFRVQENICLLFWFLHPPPPLSVETKGPLVSGGNCGFLDYTFAMKHNILSARSFINPFRLHPANHLIPLLPLSRPFQHCIKPVRILDVRNIFAADR